jgi:hypothetical protein
MPLLNRIPRPLKRDSETLRDTRLFIVACDDTYAPKQYFGFFRLTRVHVHVVETTDGTSAAKHVLNRLLQYQHAEDDERWMLLDTDHCTEGGHTESFMKALGEARQMGINIGLSKPSFELWLLLHHIDENAVKELKHAAHTAEKLAEVLGQYNKTRLRAADFPLEAIAEACARAERLDAKVTGGDNPTANTTRVYALWKAVIGKWYGLETWVTV